VWQGCHFALHKAKQAFLQAFGLENFDLILSHFLAFLDTFGLKDLTLAIMLIFGFVFGFFSTRK